jgi:Tfp pilus assembly protein PilN
VAQQTLEEKLSWSNEISGEITELKNSISEVGTSSENYGLVFDYMQNRRARVDGDLAEIVRALPPSVTLGEIRHNCTTAQVGGSASSEKAVLQYITGLEDSRLFGRIVITSMVINDDGRHDFTLSLDTVEQQSDISGTDVILRYFPADVSLTSLRQNGDTTVIEANAPDEESIVLFLEDLEKCSLFEEISLNSQTDASDGSIDFVFTVKGIL